MKKLDRLKPNTVVTVTVGATAPQRSIYLGLTGWGKARRARFLAVTTRPEDAYEWEARRVARRWVAANAQPLTVAA